MKAIFIPYHMIETGEGRREFDTFATERSVFYHWGIDWMPFFHDWCAWCRILRESRN